MKKLHSLRSTCALVKTPECWIYRLWCLKDGRSYIGQTGVRGGFRRTADRGRNHVRLGADYFRGWVPANAHIFLPAKVYWWICMKGPENFIITPLEFVAPSWATVREAWWMKKWGLGSLSNKDISNMRGGKWDFLVQRKVRSKETTQAGGSLLRIARDIASSPGFCLVSVLPHGAGGGGGLGWVWQNFRVGGCPTPPPPGGVGLCGDPWVYRASATSFFLLLQVPCNMFIYGVFTWHCISRVHAPRP